MTYSFWFSLIGLIISIIGSIILAFNLSSLIKMITTAIEALQLSIISISKVLTNRSFDAYVFSGFEKQLDKLSGKSRNKTIWGIILLIFGFFLQAIGLIASVFISTCNK